MSAARSFLSTIYLCLCTM